MSKREETRVNVNQVNNLPEINVIDNTTTKGGVSANFNLNDQTESESELSKLDKNQVFKDVDNFFCPVSFDSTELEKNLSPLVASGILSEDAKNKAIETAKKEFLQKHSDEIEKANGLTFAEVLQKLESNKTLFEKVLQVCKVSEIKEENYIVNGKVAIYRANQCQDKEGNNRYDDCTLRKEINGKTFTSPLYVEYRDVNTSNVLLSIRYYQSFLNAQKSLLNKVSDYKKILDYVREMIQKAKDNGFSKEQITDIVNEVYGC